ncbi:MAG TPA: FtsX-like permease family protein, partial [Gammaproteobacteria bacterium]|nr:FtsX-like permease family protein [Gammaproteobacteria bacterium]
LLTGADARELDAFRTKSLVLEPGARGQSSLLAPVQGRLEMLFAVSGVVLLLCCANIAGLMLVRGSARSGEMAVRASMGATRGRLASLLLAESLLLALPAVLLSLPVALLSLRGIASGMPGIPPAAFDVGLDVRAALVAIGVAAVSAVVFGLCPAWGLIRKEPGKTLQAFGVRQTSGKGVTRFRMSLAAAQIALSMALLAMTGVFAQSLANIARIELGVDVDSVVTFSISPQVSGYSPDASARLFDRLETELDSIPGVGSAAFAALPILSGGGLTTRAAADGAGGPIRVRTYLNYISPHFFPTLGIAVLAGRGFDDRDTAGAAQVAIVTQGFAQQLGFGRDVIGRRIRVPGTDAAIVGVAADAKYVGVTADIEPQVFIPRGQSTFGSGSATFYVRSARAPRDFMAAVRKTAVRVDPIVPITDLRTMRQQVRENLSAQRVAAGASTAFAVLATVLAGLGLYGVLAYSVAQRSREIGLRIALGSPASRIRGMVLREVAVMALVGTVLGGSAAFLLGRAARSLLYGVEAADPIAFAAAAIVLAAVTLGAAYVPARRASRVDPMVVLRYE